MTETTDFNSELYFDTMPLKKMVILTLCTQGYYAFVWTYQIWKKLAPTLTYKINPFWRAFFASFTNFKLYPIINNYFKQYNIKNIPAYIYAALFLILLYISNKEESLYILPILSLVVFITLSIQSKINQINKDHFPEAPVNSWTFANTMWSIAGVAVYILIVIGTLCC